MQVVPGQDHEPPVSGREAAGPLLPAGYLALLALVVVACTFGPGHEQLWLIPWHEDTERWVGRATLDYPGWWRWLLFERHWVGWRPVTAISFFANNLLTGYSIFAYQLTDLVLQCLAAASVALVTRALTRARWAICVLAAALFCIHPVMEEVVPWLDMRSYLLGVLFGNLALADFTNGLRDGDTGRRRRATAWMVMALLSNEFAFVLLPLLPLIGWLYGRDRREIWGQLRWLLFWALLVVAARVVVLHDMGGYPKPVYAYLGANGSRELLEHEPIPRLDVFTQAWAYTFFPSSVIGIRSPWAVGWGVGVGSLIGLYLAWEALWRPLRRPQLRVRWLMALWLLGYALLWTLDGSWFWRFGYPMVVPAAALVAVVLGDAWTGPWPRRAWLLVAPALLIGGWLVRSPLIEGHSTESLRVRREATATMLLVEREVAKLEAGRVYVVVPFKAEYAERITLWAQLQLGTGVDLRLLASAKPGQGPRTRSDLVDVDGRTQLRLVAEHMRWQTDRPIRHRVTRRKGGARPRRGPTRPIWLDTLDSGRVPTAYVWVDGEMHSGGVMVLTPKN